tara:strand:- start:1179 stop:1520 length:342 start_codon:yes stop_codon:yes gene_type:complete
MIIKFQKEDQYGNSIFVATLADADVYTTLNGFHMTLKKMELSTFLPIYSTPEFATIRFKPNRKFKFVEHNTYVLTLEVRKKNHKEKDYVSCYILDSKLSKVATPVDYGDVLEL